MAHGVAHEDSAQEERCLQLLNEIELEELEPKIDELEKAIKSMLVPKDPRDEKNVIVEVRAGTGGDEAALFAADLFRMYSRYAENKRWKSEILSENAIGCIWTSYDGISPSAKVGMAPAEAASSGISARLSQV